MKTKFTVIHRITPLVLLAILNSQLPTGFAQGTAFTYQGRLNASGNPAKGNYDLQFTLFNTNTTGFAIAGPVTNSAVVATNGLFTTTIDFGAGVFTGGSNWLEIAVRTNGAGAFSALTPRQPLTPTPYAITAGNLATVAQFNMVATGGFATVGGGIGNTASSLYTTVGGGSGNTASGSYATVAGGIGNTASGNTATVAGGDYNNASFTKAFVGGGF